MKESGFITLKDGRRLAYIEYGNPNGKPLFFFHGWPGSRYSGKETDEAAKSLGIRVISTDRPGIGLSDFQKDRTLLDWPDDVIQLAGFLNIRRFAVLGVSGGGPYVSVCAYKIPERITKAGIVVGLAPVNVKGNLDGMAFRGKIGWANYHAHPWARIIAAFGMAIEFRYLPEVGQLFVFPTKQDRILYREAMGKRSREESGAREAFRQGIRGPEHELKIYTDEWGFDLKDITAKVYLWYSSLDKCAPLNMGKYYHAQIPGSKLYIDPNGGHLSRYQYEEKILKVLID